MTLFKAVTSNRVILLQPLQTMLVGYSLCLGSTATRASSARATKAIAKCISLSNLINVSYCKFGNWNKVKIGAATIKAKKKLMLSCDTRLGARMPAAKHNYHRRSGCLLRAGGEHKPIGTKRRWNWCNHGCSPNWKINNLIRPGSWLGFGHPPTSAHACACWRPPPWILHLSVAASLHKLALKANDRLLLPVQGKSHGQNNATSKKHRAQICQSWFCAHYEQSDN